MLILPSGYANPIPDCESTEKAIKQVKDMFQNNLSAQLALLRVTAPIAVMKDTGLNDDLNGSEHAVTFPVKSLGASRGDLLHTFAAASRHVSGAHAQGA